MALSHFLSESHFLVSYYIKIVYGDFEYEKVVEKRCYIWD